MAIVFDGPVTPDALTAFVREVPTPADQVLNRLLPDRTLTQNRVDLNEATRHNRVAKFRAFDGRIHRTERDVVETRSVKLPPLSSMNGIGEYERLQLEAARTGGTDLGTVIDAIYDDATNLTREVRNRMELARGDVLVDGKMTLNGEQGLYLEADYGVPANHFVAPAALWSNYGAATIVADLTAWRQTYIDTNGFPPGGFVTSERVLGYMLRNAEIRQLAASLSGTPQLVTRPGLASVLDAFGLPGLLFSYDTKLEVDNVNVSVIPDDRVIFVPPAGSELGYTAWGVTATSLELVNSNLAELSFADAPGIVGVVEKSGPPYREETFVDAVGMPVLTNPKRLFVADVA